MKVVLAALSLITAFSYTASADDADSSSSQSRKTLNKNTLKYTDESEGQSEVQLSTLDDTKKAKVVYSSENTITEATIVIKGGLGDGDRVNMTIWNPRISAQISPQLSAYLTSPFSWWTDQASEHSARLLGRPQVGSIMSVVNSSDLKLSTTVSTRLPVFDMSSGRSEMFRVWGGEGSVSIDKRVSDSSYHFIGSTSLDLETNAALSFSNSYTSSDGAYWSLNNTNSIIRRAPVVRASAGLAKESDRYLISATYNIVNGIGMNHQDSTYVSSSSYYDSRTQSSTYDINPIDLSYIAVSGSLKFSESTKLTGTLIKGIKIVDNANAGNAFISSFDRLEELANLGFQLGLSQNF